MTYRHADLRLATRESILDALDRCSEIGEEAFLRETGYGPSRTYRLVHGSVSYPSKAVLGYAAQLTHREFFGGADKVVPILQRLGFRVTADGALVGDLGLLALARKHRLPTGQYERGTAGASIVYASGSNRPGEISGLAGLAVNVGVAIPQVNLTSMVRLTELRGTDVQVFADSGAFGEVKLAKGKPPTWPKPISDLAWCERLAKYRTLAVALGSQLSIVAPDKVACQQGSLRRLGRFREHLGDLDNLGARILVPLQVGELSYTEYANRVTWILGHTRWIPAVPCMKAATSPEQLRQLMRELRPAHVHLLGMGPKGKRIAEYADAVREVDEHQSFGLDSNLLTSQVERRKRIRKYTLGKILAIGLLGWHADWRAKQLTPDQTAAHTELAIHITFTRDS